ncbi:MAG: cupredoxin domain-containing protein [Nitrospirota bacterium]
MKLIKYLIIFFIFASAGFAQERAGKVYRAAVDPDGIQRVKITGGDYYFAPDYIIVKVNVPVELSVVKEAGIVPHNIVINAPEAGINVNKTMGKDPELIKFTPLRAGKYPFYCDKKFLFFKSHREKGMEGIIEIIE